MHEEENPSQNNLTLKAIVDAFIDEVDIVSISMNDVFLSNRSGLFVLRQGCQRAKLVFIASNNGQRFKTIANLYA